MTTYKDSTIPARMIRAKAFKVREGMYGYQHYIIERMDEAAGNQPGDPDHGRWVIRGDGFITKPARWDATFSTLRDAKKALNEYWERIAQQ